MEPADFTGAIMYGLRHIPTGKIFNRGKKYHTFLKGGRNPILRCETASLVFEIDDLCNPKNALMDRVKNCGITNPQKKDFEIVEYTTFITQAIPIHKARRCPKRRGEKDVWA
jgi:hypothetical protein